MWSEVGDHADSASAVGKADTAAVICALVRLDVVAAMAGSCGACELDTLVC